MKEQDNLVYYDKERNQFYTITWYDTGNNEIPTRHYIDSSETKTHGTLTDCHDCGAKPGQIHSDNCDVERCSVCGGQRLQCNCKGHDKVFARWTGIWPGSDVAEFLGLDLDQLYETGIYKTIFIKPKVKKSKK